MQTVMGTVHQLILERGFAEARRATALDKNERLCVDAAYEVMTDERGQIGVVHAGFAMAALPHKKTAEMIWERDGGQVNCSSRAGWTVRRGRSEFLTVA